MVEWGGCDRVVAEYAGVSESHISAQRRRFGIPPAQRAYKGRAVDAPIDPAVDVDGEVLRDREMLRLKSDMSDLQRKYAVACKSGNLHEDILEIARAEMGKLKAATILPPKIGTSKTKEDAILGWADWHGGAQFGPEVMQGYNAYDPVVMCRRAQYTVDRTLKILFECHVGTTFGKLHIFDLSDDVEGDLRDEQKISNALPVFESARLVTAVKSQALTELSAHIPIVYYKVPGNHGRRGDKMWYGLPTETVDWLIGEMIADRVRDNPRIECVIPKAWTYQAHVRGHNHSLNHGFTSAKGGAGGISWYALQRSDGHKTALEATRDHRVHYRWYGHIHQDAQVPMMDGSGTQFIIGSLMGGNPHALEGLAKYAEPVQKLVGAHDDYGVTWGYQLNVKFADDKPSRYESLLG